MKTLLQQSLLVFLLCIISSHRIWGEEVDCRDIGGTVPIPIYNSHIRCFQMEVYAAPCMLEILVRRTKSN